MQKPGTVCRTNCWWTIFLSFLIAGFDTTAFALTWTLYLISQSPEWEARILDEVQQVAGDGPVTSAHVARLVIVQQVLKESLRLFPTAPLIVRDILKDVQFDGVTVAKGTLGFIPIYAIHRHRSFWKTPIASIQIVSLPIARRSQTVSSTCRLEPGRGSASVHRSR